MTLDDLKDILRREKCSCVISDGRGVTLCHQRGVKDLFHILKSSPGLLSGALIADKIVGKGAAALMILGGVSEVYAEVVSRPALDLLTAEGIAVQYDVCVPAIINRAGTGICPVETLCSDCLTARDCLPLIENFINQLNTEK